MKMDNHSVFLCVLTIGCALPLLAAANTDTSNQTQPKLNQKPLWIDQQHQRIETTVDAGAKTVDGWFKSEQAKHTDARATLKLYLDNDWNEYKGIETKVRVRGKIHLPNMNERLNLVFGDDSLDDETASDITSRSNRTSSNQKVANNRDLPDASTIRDNAKDDNASVALRYAKTLYNKSGLDLDLGIRSGSDIYTRARLDYKKPLQNGWLLTLEPTLRYGTKSKFYAQQMVRLGLRPSVATSQWYDAYHSETVLRYAETDNDGANPIGVRWSQRYNVYKSFGHEKTLDYGVQMDGRLKDTHSNLDSYGIYGSYRQPFLRDWFYVRGDVNYLNGRRLERSWHPSVFLRLETHF